MQARRDSIHSRSFKFALATHNQRETQMINSITHYKKTRPYNKRLHCPTEAVYLYSASDFTTFVVRVVIIAFTAHVNSLSGSIPSFIKKQYNSLILNWPQVINHYTINQTIAVKVIGSSANCYNLSTGKEYTTHHEHALKEIQN